MRDALAFSLGLLLMVGAPAAAHAQQPTADVQVDLLAGGSVTGRLVEIAPGDHVSVALGGERIEKIPWSTVARIGAPGSRPPPQPAPPPPPESQSQPEQAPPATPPAHDDLVTVEIRSPNTVQLERRSETGMWTVLCATPCGERVPVDGDYRISDNGRPVGKIAFRPNQAGSTVVLHVARRSNSIMALGIVAVSIGGIMALGAAINAEDARDEQTNLMVGLLGLGLTAFGTVALATNRTVVRNERDVAATTPKTGLAMRAPAPGPSFPLLSFRF